MNRRTGTRWRFGRVVRLADGRALDYPPVINNTVTVLSDRYLSSDERIRIADLRAAGTTIAEIAADLRRSPSTVSRELRRNVGLNGRYRPHHADRVAAARRRRAGRRRLARDAQLRAVVQQLIGQKWSPEQVSRELRRRYPEQPVRWLTPKSIYQAVYHAVLTRDRAALRTGRTRRRPHRRPDQWRPTGPRKSIRERPPAAAARSEAGRWQGDLIMGTHNRSAIATLVDRWSRYTLLLHLAGKSADAVAAALIGAFAVLPADLRRSLTWDQGTELAAHDGW